MSTSAVGSLSGSYLQQLLAGSGPTGNTNGAATSPQDDSSEISPFAQLVSSLEQLQQSDPTEYKQVTAEIAGNLQSASQTATSQGNSSAASQLNQLATDFTSASQSGQLPNLQDLAQALGGGSGGHHHHQHAQATSSGDSTNSGSSTSQISQLLASLTQISDSQSLSDTSSLNTASALNTGSTNPFAIILQTLANPGVNTSNS